MSYSHNGTTVFQEGLGKTKTFISRDLLVVGRHKKSVFKQDVMQCPTATMEPL